MNNPKSIQAGILAFMKFTFLQIIIATTVTALAYSHNTSGQEVLEKKVSLKVTNENMKSVLKKIEHQIAIIFTYNADLLAHKNKITIEFDSIRLSDAIDLL